MPIDHSGVGYRRIAGLYEALIAEQQAAVVKIDLRLLDWTLEDHAEAAVDRAEVKADAKAHPKRSALLDKLMIGEPMTVGWSEL